MAIGAAVLREGLASALKASSVSVLLKRQGWAVVDGGLSARWLDEARREMKLLHEWKLLLENSSVLVHRGKQKLLQKQGILEMELQHQGLFEFEEMSQIVPRLHELYEDTTLMRVLSTGLPELQLQSQAMKLQLNTGSGGCFPLHHDSDDKVDERVITAIMYNNPQWTPKDGGQLRLYPLTSARVDIAPIAGRIVLFSSQHMLHRVQPSTAERWCLTNWLSGSLKSEVQHEERIDDDNISRWQLGGEAPSAHWDADDLGRAVLEEDILTDPAKRKLVAKAIYANEWEESLRQSHPPTEHREAVIHAHQSDVQRIQSLFFRQADPRVVARLGELSLLPPALVQ